MIAQGSIYKSQHASTKLHTIPASTMNSTRPVAVSHGPVYEEPDQTSHSIRLVVLPLIFVVGFFGNTLSASLFLGKTLRMKSCSIYLATKTISDNGFLLSLFVAWLDFVDVRIFHTQVVCHVAVFISYVCGFVSVWSVVMVTVDNYIRICRPSEVSSLCTPYIAWRLTVFGVVFACMLYNYPLWTLGVSTSNPQQQTFCQTLPKFERFEVVMTYLDTVLTLVLPLFIIIILVCVIAVRLVDVSKRKDRLRKSSSYASVSSKVSGSNGPSLPYSQVTKMLLSVSVVFVCLHTPSHAIRMKVTLESLLGQTTVTSETDRILNHFFLVLYYLNFSVYFFIFVGCGQNFRKVLKKKAKQMCDRRNNVTSTSNVVSNRMWSEDRELETTKDTLDVD